MKTVKVSDLQQANNTSRIIRGAKKMIDRAIEDGVKTVSEYKRWIQHEQA